MLLWATAVRVALGLLAIPLAPFLYREHFVLLVLLRPTKEVLLAGGFLIRRGDVAPLPVLVAAVPLVVLGVWLFYALGLAYRRELRGTKLPWLLGRLLPPDRIRQMTKALDRAGARVVFLGRLAVFPSSVMGAAAGTSKLPPRQFLAADGAGALVSSWRPSAPDSCWARPTKPPGRGSRAPASWRCSACCTSSAAGSTPETCPSQESSRRNEHAAGADRAC